MNYVNVYSSFLLSGFAVFGYLIAKSVGSENFEIVRLLWVSISAFEIKRVTKKSSREVIATGPATCIIDSNTMERMSCDASKDLSTINGVIKVSYQKKSFCCFHGFHICPQATRHVKICKVLISFMALFVLIIFPSTCKRSWLRLFNDR